MSKVQNGPRAGQLDACVVDQARARVLRMSEAARSVLAHEFFERRRRLSRELEAAEANGGER